MSKITFSTHPDIVDSIPHPKPASKFVPDWYKKLKNEYQCPVSEVDTMPTIKQCLPVRDFITSGYIIPAWCDMVFKKDSKGVIHVINRMPDHFKHFYNMGFEGHEIAQVKGTPLEHFSDGEKILKINNPWMIYTPSGYSCFIMSPFYQTSDLTILPGVVDTDNHKLTTNFPCIVSDTEVILKKGEPLIQVIPFKRDNWVSEINSYSEQEQTASKIRFFTELKSVYTTKLWKRKYYR